MQKFLQGSYSRRFRPFKLQKVTVIDTMEEKTSNNNIF